jgi:hypothetical protein
MAEKIQWSDDEVKLVVDLIKEGLTYKELSEKVNKKIGSVRKKLAEFNLKSSQFEKEKYYETIVCKNVECQKVLSVLKSNNQKFCGKSCASKVNNIGVVRNGVSKKSLYCLYCDEKLYKGIKFCSCDCQVNYERKIIFESIEKGYNQFSILHYKRYLIHKFGNKCMKCNWSEVNPVTNKVPIQIEHIDGNHENNELSNLLLLCPNCHSLTTTYGSLNKGKGKGRSDRRQYRKV